MTSKEGTGGGEWEHVDYEPGADEFWDQLGGSEWGAIDGVMPGVRVYATWDEQRDTRLVVTGLVLRGSPDHPVTSDTLRAVPIGRLEAAANEVRTALGAKSLSRPEVKLSRPAGVFRPTSSTSS